jgi:hypothetical protein
VQKQEKLENGYEEWLTYLYKKQMVQASDIAGEKLFFIFKLINDLHLQA